MKKYFIFAIISLLMISTSCVSIGKNKGFNYVKHSREGKKMRKASRGKGFVKRHIWENKGMSPKGPRQHSF
jgi:hypothetical protein